MQAREDAAVVCLSNTSLYVLIYINKGTSRCVYTTVWTEMELSLISADKREGSRLFKEHVTLCINSCNKGISLCVYRTDNTELSFFVIAEQSSRSCKELTT